MAMSAQKNSKTVRTVQDSKGSVYELRSELSRGGQGVVYHTQYPQVLVKGFTSKDERLRQRWRQRLAWLIRQDLADLKIARPLVLLAEPRCGYVMELMDGLVPLQSLLESYVAAGEEFLADYQRQGGLRRRIRILCQLARTLNQLHARGMLYGDLSPSNIFVSDDPAYAETWLIDCDNISLEAHSSLTLHTADYGAPEVVRGDGLLSSLTDVWSFAVIAYQLLTHNHPFKGEQVNDGEPEEEDAALRGERPWIYDGQDDTNACFNNLPIQLMEHSKLPGLFARCFEQGKVMPSERPGMAEWLEALSEVDERLIHCAECGATTLVPLTVQTLDEQLCFFCDEPLDKSAVLFEEFIELVPEEEQSEQLTTPETHLATGRKVWLQPGQSVELKRLMPTFSYDLRPSDHIRIEYLDKGLGIYALPEAELTVQRGAIDKPLERDLMLKESLRGHHSEPYRIHVGDMQKTHVFWQFSW